MSFKKFMPYELKKNYNVKKNVAQSKFATPSGTSGVAKRDVYPQFSEPDDYGFTRNPQRATLQQERYSNQNKQLFINKPWSNTQSNIDGGYQNLGSPMPLYQPMSTFRQYLKEDEVEQMVSHDNKHFKMSGTQTNNSSNPRKTITQFTSNVEEKPENTIHQTRNSKAFVGTRIRHMIGSVDQVIRWHKMAKNSELELYYEVAGILESTINKDGVQLFLVRSESGNILQGVFYNIDREFPKLSSGSLITATGNMTGSNKLHIFDLNVISRDDFLAVQRLGFLSQRALEEVLKCHLSSL